MNVFEFRNRLIEDYRAYVTSFLRIQDPAGGGGEWKVWIPRQPKSRDDHATRRQKEAL